MCIAFLLFAITFIASTYKGYNFWESIIAGSIVYIVALMIDFFFNEELI